MANRWTNTLKHSDVTPEAVFLNRRQLIAGAAGAGVLASIGGGLHAQETLEPNSYEAWSMVIPWNGFELSDMLAMAGVQSGAKYVAFETALRPDEMPGVRFPALDWPYVEGLRLDEAMHPLTIMATGIYGKPSFRASGGRRAFCQAQTHTDVQRLRGRGGGDVRRHGSQDVLLIRGA